MRLRRSAACRLTPWMAVLPLFLCLSCSEDSPVDVEEPVIPLPDYLIEKGPVGSANAIGWAQMSALPHADSLHYELVYTLPGHPFRSRVEIDHSLAGESVVHDWRLGRDGGPWIQTRIAQGNRGDWAWVQRGWGEFELRTDLLPADEEPVVVDPLSPLSFALLAWRWDEAGRPRSLDLTALWISAGDGRPDTLAARLVDNGELSQDGFDLRSFQLELPNGTLFFKIMLDHFPALMNAWWDTDQLALRYWPGLADLSDQEFDPEFPEPEGYAVEDFTLVEGNLNLAAQIFRPEGEGPFTALLLLADNGPADRDDAAVFAHLAHELARHGCLVHRHDKAGTGASTGSLDSLDLGGRRRALTVAWQNLRADPDADPARCLLLGHGEGAALALEAAAADPDAAGVIALAAPYYDPAALPLIPEAIDAVGDFIDALGLSCFVDKYRDRLEFDTAAYLSNPTWSGRPVLLYRGEQDEIVSWEDLEAQANLLNVAGANLEYAHWPELDHFLNRYRPDDPPDSELVGGILDWLEENFGRDP